MPRKPRTPDHCQYVSPLGRKCPQLRHPGHPSFCQHHSGQPPQALNESCAAQLLGQIEDFSSAAPVNQFLANLLRMTARGLIARRDAAVLAYIAQSLLNGLAARRRELLDEQALAENEPTRLIWDIPRPRREEEQDAPQDADRWSDRARYERLARLTSRKPQGAEEPALAASPAGSPAPTARPGGSEHFSQGNQ